MDEDALVSRAEVVAARRRGLLRCSQLLIVELRTLTDVAEIALAEWDEAPAALKERRVLEQLVEQLEEVRGHCDGVRAALKRLTSDPGEP